MSAVPAPVTPPAQRPRPATMPVATVEPPAPIALVPQRSATPMDLLQIAMDQGADLDRLERLMALQDAWEAREARKAFVVAMAGFKANPPSIGKNHEVDFQSAKGRVTYKHATLDEVALKIGTAMAPFGLSFRWNVEQVNGRVRVTCIIQHVLGHAEQVVMDGPADDSGSKNQIQAVGSTVTYLQRYTLLAASGMAVKDQDDDGAGGGPSFEIEEGIQALQECRSMDALYAAFRPLFKKAQDSRNARALKAWTDAKELRKKELNGQGGGK